MVHERLREIIKMADKLGWIKPKNNTSYTLMELSEVEKCMIAMIDDNYLEQIRKWTNYFTIQKSETGKTI
jgi:hypothetical protein